MSAVFSEDGRFRYTLTRDLWDGVLDPRLAQDTVAFVCLNPSTATATDDDPTVRRCIGFARSWAFTRLVVVNIFARRSTDPKLLYAEPPDAVVGPENDSWIEHMCRSADRVVCAWGTHGAHLSRGEIVRAKLRSKGVTLSVLGLTKGGHPRHPLYLSKVTLPVPWDIAHPSG